MPNTLPPIDPKLALLQQMQRNEAPAPMAQGVVAAPIEPSRLEQLTNFLRTGEAPPVPAPTEPAISPLERIKARLQATEQLAGQSVPAASPAERILSRGAETNVLQGIAGAQNAASPAERIQARLSNREPAGAQQRALITDVASKILKKEAPTDRIKAIEKIKINPSEGKSISDRLSSFLSDLSPFNNKPSPEVGVGQNELVAGALIGALPALIGSIFAPNFAGTVAQAGPAGVKILTDDILSRPRLKQKRDLELLKTARALEDKDFNRSISLATLELGKQKQIGELEKQGLTPEQAADSLLKLENLSLGERKINVSNKARKGKITQNQSDAARQFVEMEPANQQYNVAREKGFDPTLITNKIIASLPFADVSSQLIQNIAPDSLGPNTKLIKEAMSAEINFITPLLRKESGAAISVSEWIGRRKSLFPQPGDSFQVQTNKALIRKRLIDAMKASAGPALENLTPTEVLKKQAEREVRRVQPKPKPKIESKRSVENRLKDLERRAKKLGIKVK